MLLNCNFINKLILKLKNIKFRNKLLLSYISVTGVAIFIIGIVAFYYSVKVYQEEMADRSFEIMNQINKNIEYYIKNADLLINSLYIRSDYSFSPFIENLIGPKSEVPSALLNTDREFTKFFAELTYLRNDCTGIFFRADNGLEYSRFLYGFQGYNPNHPWYRKTCANRGKITVFGTHRQFFSDNGMLVFSLAKQLINPINKEGIGVILLDFDLGTIKKICQGVNFGKDSKIAICDDDFNIVYHTDQTLIMQKLKPELISAIKSNRTGIANVILNSQKYLVTYNTSASAGWKLVSMIPMDTLMKRWKFIGYLTFFIGITLLMVMFLISLILSNSISKPLLRLIQLMKVVEKGDFSVPFESYATDEIGQLNRGFATMVSKINDLIQREYKMKLAKREADLKALLAQINPHFLYNTLETISTISLVQKVPEIDKIAVSLARMFRYSIKTKSEVVPLRAELNHIEDYLTIYRLRFDKEIHIEYQICEEFLNYGILKLTIQPLVENAIIHGIEKTNRAGVISISVQREREDLIVKVSDNGVGLDEEQLVRLREAIIEGLVNDHFKQDNNESIGLRNVHARLALFYGPNYGISISSQKNSGTIVALRVPAIVSEVDERD